MNKSDKKQAELKAVVEAAYRIAEDVGAEVEAALRLGAKEPLEREELRRLLTRIVKVMKGRAAKRGVPTALDGEVEDIVEEIMSSAIATLTTDPKKVVKKLELATRNGVDPGPVWPVPIFHGTPVQMKGGWVRTRDINLWSDNERLEIHVAQFQQQNDRPPNPQELLDIMMSKMTLPGISPEADQFEIVNLARSIATNGVRKAPIIDLIGTLLDGNRRVTACHYILNSEEFDTEQKKRAEWLYVWQLTEHATPEEREKVVVSLNFEPDYKKDWPEYIKARKIYEEWEAMIALEGDRLPGGKRQAEMKRQLSMRYALGPTTNVVNRYLKMMDWADQFEAYHVNEREQDKFAVKHRTNEAFQYFDELSKGQSEGGVAYLLGEDEPLRHAVFDLLFDSRFRNWKQIRDLKYVAQNEDARDLLFKAKKEPDPDLAEEYLDQSIAIARTRRAEERKVGANTRIESFVKWIKDVPSSAWWDGSVRVENLKKLLEVLEFLKELLKKGTKETG